VRIAAGAQVKVDDPLITLESDKVSVDITQSILAPPSAPT
jgi:pyruvate/2-oxoglutarate dehydrogenase complex dihydrolipoamide acyltransferase (E2) component